MAAMAAMAGAGPGPAEGPCVLCCGELDVVALGRCEHPICYRCSVRMRALCGVRYCAVCREELRQVRPGPGLGGPRAGRGSSRAGVNGPGAGWDRRGRTARVIHPLPPSRGCRRRLGEWETKREENGVRVNVYGVKSAGLALAAENGDFAPCCRRKQLLGGIMEL